MPKLEQMEIFYTVATWKSFSKAALQLGVSKAYVSTQVSALEKDLGVKLLQRSTRHLNLTEEGSLFYESCSKIVLEKKYAISLIKELHLTPSGQLKISAPPSMCNTFLIELFQLFQKRYPNISLTIDSSSEMKNLLKDNIDVALRVTHTPDENYIARLITSFRFVVCTTPGYLKEHGTPKLPDELLQHNCLIYSSDPTENRWPFTIDGKVTYVNVQGNLIASDIAILRNALLNDQGIVRLPEYAIAKELAAKKIVSLFTENTQLEIPIYAIYQSAIQIPLKIKYFIDFIRTNLLKKSG